VAPRRPSPNGRLSLRLRAASEYDPSCHAPSCTLSRGFAIPKRNPAAEIHHSRALAFPGHVAPSRLPCASAPYSLDGLPGILFNQVRSRDPRPSELDLAEVAAHLSMPAVPLAIGHAGPLSTHRRGRRCFERTLEAASLQGLSRCRLGPARWIFSALRESWLSWVSPPWGSPLPCSDLAARALSSMGFRAAPSSPA